MQALDAVAAAERGRTLAAQPVYNRAAIVAAGPAANFLLAMVLFTGLFYAMDSNCVPVDSFFGTAGHSWRR